MRMITRPRRSCGAFKSKPVTTLKGVGQKSLKSSNWLGPRRLGFGSTFSRDVTMITRR